MWSCEFDVLVAKQTREWTHKNLRKQHVNGENLMVATKWETSWKVKYRWKMHDFWLPFREVHGTYLWLTFFKAALLQSEVCTNYLIESRISLRKMLWMSPKFWAFIPWVRKNPTKFPPNFPQNFPLKKSRRIHRVASVGAHGKYSWVILILVGMWGGLGGQVDVNPNPRSRCWFLDMREAVKRFAEENVQHHHLIVCILVVQQWPHLVIPKKGPIHMPPASLTLPQKESGKRSLAKTWRTKWQKRQKKRPKSDQKVTKVIKLLSLTFCAPWEPVCELSFFFVHSALFL